MKKLLMLCLFLGAVQTMPVYAGASSEPSLWDRLRKKIETLTPQKKLSSTTAAGGVRGSLADAQDVYWKGEAKVQAIDADELEAFKKAMALVEGGNTADARAAFSDFIKQHPDSSLRADAEAALTQLQAPKQ